MSLVLNTNIDALIAQNSLTSSGSQLSTALQQLSSGLRINTAADDAAGYAIAQGMTSQINGLNQAAQNANDGVSLAQTASGAMQEITNDLQSMRDLAVESLNASNSATDRTDLNAQFTQLMNDINSVSAQTQFNGVNLLDGSFQGATFQVGANAGQSITIGAISNASASSIGNYYTGAGAVAGASVQTASGSTLYTSGAATLGVYSATNLAGASDLNTAVDGSTVTLNVNVDGTNYQTSAITLTGNSATDLKSIAAAVNQALSPAGGLVATVNGSGIQISGTAAAGTGHIVNFSVASATSAAGTSVTAGANTLKDLGVDSADVVGTYYTGATAPSYAATGSSAASSTASTSPGTDTYSVTITGAGAGTYSAGAIAMTGTAATDLAAVVAGLNANASFTGAGFSASAVGGKLQISSSKGAFTVASESNSGSGTFTAGFSSVASTSVAGTPGTTAVAPASTNYLSSLNVTTVDNSNLTLISIDNALQQLATSSADLGAYQNRFQAAITGLNTDSTNLSAAKSSIVDANYAQATSDLSKAQILQQACTAMVAQANLIPQNILTLLQKLP